MEVDQARAVHLQSPSPNMTSRRLSATVIAAEFPTGSRAFMPANLFTGNLFKDIPQQLEDEQVEPLVNGRGVLVERIVSRGHSSPASGWYDQPRHEWVVVLRGRGVVSFENGDEVSLGPGDYLGKLCTNRWRLWLTGLFAIKALARRRAHCPSRGGNAECGQTRQPLRAGRQGPSAVLQSL